jgi:2-methylcitrate dehydratase PrpD
MKKIDVQFDAEINKDFPRCRPCKITLKTKEQEYGAENHYRHGDPETPMSQSEVEDKFIELTDGFLSKALQERYINWLSSVESSDEIPF